MLVTMSRGAIDSLDNATLAWICIEPTIHGIRGKAPSFKMQVYSELTAGQRALLMFWVLHGHARHGVAEFYPQVDYLLAQVDLWRELKEGMRYFGADAMMRLVEEMEGLHRLLVAMDQPEGGARRDVDAGSLKGNAALSAITDRLDAAFPEADQSAMERIGARIRENPAEFIRIEG